MCMGKSFSKSQLKEREGIGMAPEQRRPSGNDSSRTRLHNLIDSDVYADVLRHCLKNWDAKRSGMRESLPGDRKR